MIPNSAIFVDQCLVQPSSEMLPPAADGNNYRDLQPDFIHRTLRDLGILQKRRQKNVRGR